MSHLLYSFDLFDTLIERPLKRPYHVFDLVEFSGGVIYRIPGARIFGFRRWRILAERLARVSGSREDISIVAIYRVLGWLIRDPAAVLRRELAMEAALLRPIAENVARLADLLDRGQRCCVLTDMYLPAVFLQRIVKKCLGRNVVLFASSQIGLTKRSGTLYQYVADHYGVSLRDICHIGDNPDSDYDVPMRLGMSAEKLPERSLRDTPQGVFELFYARDLWEDVFSRLGYSLVGPVCAAFAEYLREEVERTGVDKVFFCARDTYLIKEAFDSICPQIASTYLRVSRRAAYIPEFARSGDCQRLFEGRVSGVDFFRRLDMDLPDDELAGLDPAGHRTRFIGALEQAGFREKAEIEAETLDSYLQDAGVTGRVALVDIGWRGSLQGALATVVGDRARIEGYYFGSIVGQERMHAYYFDHCRPLRRMSHVFQALPVFEFLFTEPVRSLKRIVKEGDGYAFELVEDEPDEQLRHRQAVAAGCRRFLADYWPVRGLLGADSRKFLKPLDAVIRHHLVDVEGPTIEAFMGVGHAEGFGGSKYARLVGDGGFSLYGYRNSYWRSAYAASVTGTWKWLARLVHGLVYSGPGVYWIYRRRGWRGLIAR